MTNLQVELGSLFRDRREALGLSGFAMARRLGLSPRQLQRIEAGRAMAQPDTVLTLQRITGLTLVLQLAAAA